MPRKTKAIKETDIRGGKPWLKKIGVTKYSIETKDLHKTFLIVCEGQSEKLYFESIPVNTAEIKAIELGCSKTTLVENAILIAENEEYDEKWCVFDMDIKPDVNGQFDDYNNAIKSAIEAGFKCAYSNDAFELWYVLHYQYIDQEQNRSFFFKKLSEYWNMNYERDGKKIKFVRTIYKLLEDDPRASQASAIRNAKKLFKEQKDKVYHLQNPVTKIFELIESLNKHLRQ
ncbi:MAG TPA: RloB family protein [Chitinophagales bacterium]|nr:RloB family protein [Chitinophagales bacterium]